MRQLVILTGSNHNNRTKWINDLMGNKSYQDIYTYDGVEFIDSPEQIDYYSTVPNIKFIIFVDVKDKNSLEDTLYTIRNIRYNGDAKIYVYYNEYNFRTIPAKNYQLMSKILNLTIPIKVNSNPLVLFQALKDDTDDLTDMMNMMDI